MDDFAEALGLDLLQRETLLHHLGVEDAELVEAKKVGNSTVEDAALKRRPILR